MKKTLFVLVFLFIFAFSASGQEPNGNAVHVYYFHGKYRCFTCINMEKYAREAVETNFKDALKSGKIEFKAVDVDEPGNEHFAKDYQLYTKSLIVSLVKNGKEIDHKNLTKIWEYAHDREKYIQYVTEEINQYQKEL